MRGFTYETANAKLASVTKEGVIKAESKGTCYIYASVFSGAYAKVKVTVK